MTFLLKTSLAKSTRDTTVLATNHLEVTLIVICVRNLKLIQLET
jgi:hypothetical protein